MALSCTELILYKTACLQNFSGSTLTMCKSQITQNARRKTKFQKLTKPGSI